MSELTHETLRQMMRTPQQEQSPTTLQSMPGPYDPLAILAEAKTLHWILRIPSRGPGMPRRG
ncbi:UNVERIFIED_CONTAM: hypothetical protein Slati_3454000 [Sesamum latifolium]|uniref:Uncharacterized protein n=1 Tax=Sesamum latifolium TaxID=2727402 RepID=A0AAW2UJT0_9LAMI